MGHVQLNENIGCSWSLLHVSVFLHSREAALYTSKLSGWMNKGGEIVEERNFGCDTNIESGWLHFVLQSLLLGEHEKAFN